jgi:hypothetical protein
MLALRESEGFRPRHPLPRPAEHAGPSPSSFANLQTFQHSNFLTLPQAIPFRITSFADPYPLTPVESHLCKKQGGGVSQLQPNHFLFFSQPVNIQRIATPATLIPSCNCAHFPSHMGVPLSSSDFRISLFEFRSFLAPTHYSLSTFHSSLRPIAQPCSGKDNDLRRP